MHSLEDIRVGDWLAITTNVRDNPVLRGYHLLPSVRGDLLQKLGRLEEACEEFKKAASMTRNERERELLKERARICDGGRQ